MPTIESILNLFAERGDSEYGGEAVTQLEHALQSATLAENDGATDELVVAALLHDVGHLLHDLDDDAPDKGIDDHHENSGYYHVVKVFPDSVTEPIRLHVTAKRYLCAVDDQYRSQLSGPSIVSLELQGGPMSDAEVEQFRANPFFEDAIKLRRWDDIAKVPDCPTPDLGHFVDAMRRVAREATNE